MDVRRLLLNEGTVEGGNGTAETGDGSPDLKTLLARLDKLEKGAEEAAAYEKHVQVLMSEGAPEHLVPAAIHAVYSKLGHNEQQIHALVEHWQNRDQTPDDDDEEEEVPSEDEKPDPTEAPKEDPMNKQELDRLRNEMDRVNSRELAREQDRIRTLLKEKARHAVDNDPNVATLLEAVRRRAAPESADQEVKTVRDQMVAAAQRTLGSKVRDSYDNHARITGDKSAWDDEWVEKASSKLGDDVAKEFRPAIGDPSLVGRSSGTDGEMSIADVLRNQKKVEAPEWKPGVDRSELERGVRDWSTQELLAAVAGEGEQTKI